jgi:hypothetical protein
MVDKRRIISTLSSNVLAAGAATGLPPDVVGVAAWPAGAAAWFDDFGVPS